MTTKLVRVPESGAGLSELEAIANCVPTPLFLLTERGQILYHNPAGGALLAAEGHALQGEDFLGLVAPRHRAAVRELLERAGRPAPAEERVEFAVCGALRGWRTVSAIATRLPRLSSVEGTLLSAIDVTEERAEQNSLRHLFLHDVVTGLGNRAMLEELLDRELRGDAEVGVLFLGLDSFKSVNSSLGHTVGDDVLRAVATRIKTMLPRSATIIRFGGDRFVVLLSGVEQERLVHLGWQLLQSLDQPLFLQGYELRIGASIGVASREPLSSSRSLLRDADAALTEAKRVCRGGVLCFTEELRTEAVRRLSLEAELRRALSRSEFELFYQPIVSLPDREVQGYEALLRWRREDGTTLAPDGFLELAEATGLIVPIGEWAMESAIASLGASSIVRTSINLSPRQLLAPGLVEQVGRLLRRYHVEPRRLVIEVTECSVLEDLSLAREVLGGLRRLGCLVGLDDFGSGYSSLGYLEQLPLDFFKLDRSLVEAVDSDDKARAVIGAIVSLGQALSLALVGEGIEREAQAVALGDLGCPLGQGFLFGRPLPLERS